MIERRLSGGIGEIDDIVGRKVELIRSQGWRGGIKEVRPYIVSDVYFHISPDGKAICCVLMEDLPDKIFTLSDIRLI